MNHSLKARRALGSTALRLPPLGFGGAAIAFRPGAGGSIQDTVPTADVRAGGAFRRLSDAEVAETLQRSWDVGITYFDTAPFYGRGGSEYRIGRFCSQEGLQEKGLTLSTKVGRILHRPKGASPNWELGGVENTMMSVIDGGMPFEFYFDYSYDGVMRSYEDSIQRLGTSEIDMLFIHDLDRSFFSDGQERAHLHALASGGARALDELKRCGHIKAVGSGINRPDAMHQMMDHADLDCLLVSQIYTLGDHCSVPERGMARCEREGVGVIAGTVFNSGAMFWRGTIGDGDGDGNGKRESLPPFNYAPMTEEQAKRVEDLRTVCEEGYGVPLAAAALQFPLAHPCVATCLVGMGAPNEVDQNVQLLETDIPTGMWKDLKNKGLIHADAPIPE